MSKNKNTVTRKKRSGDSVRYKEKVILLLLVTILSKALFTLVSGDFMTLSFFTARHSNVVYGVELLILLIKTSIWLFTDSSRTHARTHAHEWDSLPRNRCPDYHSRRNHRGGNG
jgi:hypothetical protein